MVRTLLVTFTLASDCIALVPLPVSTPSEVRVVAPVPPLPTTKVEDKPPAVPVVFRSEATTKSTSPVAS